MAGAFGDIDRLGQVRQGQRPLVGLECFEDVDEPFDGSDVGSGHEDGFL